MDYCKVFVKSSQNPQKYLCRCLFLSKSTFLKILLQIFFNGFFRISKRFFCESLITLFRSTKQEATLPEVYSGPLLTSILELFATRVNSIDKSFILDVAGVSGYNDNYRSLLVTVQICYPGSRKLLTS